MFRETVAMDDQQALRSMIAAPIRLSNRHRSAERVYRNGR